MTGARTPSPRTLDLALTAAILVVSLVEALLSAGVTGPRWLAALAGAVMSLLLLGRRRHPVVTTVLVLGVAVPAAAVLIDPSEVISPFLPVLILGYVAGAQPRHRAAYGLLALLLAGVVAMTLLDDSRNAGNVYFPALLILFCWLGGRTVRTRSAHAGELHEAAALAAERREREAQRAVADERRRIAREMHDVVAHSISLMVVQAGGARRILGADPVRAEEAAARIRSAGTDALAEMDILLGVLETAPDASPPTLDRLDELVERARAAGLPVTLEVSGTRRAMSAGAELAVYRVVQEALTNAIKHAGGATTRVRLAWSDDALDVSVADRGDGGQSPQLVGAGHGLVGMRERLRIHGGDVVTGPRADGGFEVSAHLPLERRAASAR